MACKSQSWLLFSDRDSMDASSSKEEEAEIPEKTPAEVIQDLEEVLGATVEELEQQKRLNQSLLKRKVYENYFQMFGI
jgi:hypothetical protein